MSGRKRNRELDAAYRKSAAKELLKSASFAQDSLDKRDLVYNAVRSRLEHDRKAPWSLGQKLNEAPYRYTRDEIRLALNGISDALDRGSPRLIFEVADNFSGAEGYPKFVNTCVTGTLSAFINAIVSKSRWP